MRNFILLAQPIILPGRQKKSIDGFAIWLKSIAALGRTIGYTLFTRKDNNISLNKAGQELYQTVPVYQRLSAIDMKSITQGVVHEKL
ncbi:putative LYSR-type transcriptional regulator [Escherichia coli]|uniref:Putative LYSR-type transcriptional regulator n=1 Tax=Escherichia coli TaxID=562 RepID=A0A376VDE7_ECOLX|nr:putative LYSR-type transcriptional regulator [Escherichia coli]